jgi:TPR repeat protein
MRIAGWKLLLILISFVTPLISSSPRDDEPHSHLGIKRKILPVVFKDSLSPSLPQGEPRSKKRYITPEEENDTKTEKEESLSQTLGQKTCGFDASQDPESKELTQCLEHKDAEGQKSSQKEALIYLDEGGPFGNSSLAPPIYGGLPERPNFTQFVEHTPAESDKSYLTLLREIFDIEEPFQDSKTLSCSLLGIPGIGKTSLALAYAYKANDYMRYDLIYWFQSETEEKLLNGYKNLLKALNISHRYTQFKDKKNLIRLVDRQLSTFNKKWLLVYDNVPDSDFLEGKIPQWGGHVLITSRCLEGWQHPFFLKGFRPEDCEEYFRNTLNLSYTIFEQQKSLLAQRLLYFPLALSHATSFISFKRYSLSNYLKDFEQQHAEIISAQTQSTHQDPTTPYENVIKTTLRIIQNDLSPLAQETLYSLAYLDCDFIVKDLFIKQTEDTHDIDGALAELSNFSLIKQHQDSISFHPFLQHIMRLEQEEKDLPSYLNSTMSYLISYCTLLRQRNVSEGGNNKGEHFYLKQHLYKVRDYLEYLQQNHKMKEERLLTFKIGVFILVELLKQRELEFHEPAYYPSSNGEDPKNKEKSEKKFITNKQHFIPFIQEAYQMPTIIKNQPQPTLIPKEFLENQKYDEMGPSEELDWITKIPGALSSYLMQELYEHYKLGKSKRLSQGQGILMQLVPRVISSEGQKFIENITPLLSTSIEEEVLINIIGALDPLYSIEEQRALYRIIAILLDHKEQNSLYSPLWLKELLDITKIYRTAPKTFIHILKRSLAGINTADPHFLEDSKIIIGEIVNLFGQFGKAKTVEVKNVILGKLKSYGPKANGWADYYIGWLYCRGLVDKGSEEEGITWYEHAASLGHKEAQFELATFYERMPNRKTQAIIWYKKAAKQGDIRAQLNLATLYERDLINDKAKKFYKMAALQGDSRAQYKIGKIYEKEKKYEKAKAIYELAAGSNHDKAQYKLGLFYEGGQGEIKADKFKARAYYEQAARNFNAKALYKLGLYHAEGRAGLTASQEEAYKLYKQAATFGNKGAFEELNKEGSQHEGRNDQ